MYKKEIERYGSFAVGATEQIMSLGDNLQLTADLSFAHTRGNNHLTYPYNALWDNVQLYLSGCSKTRIGDLISTVSAFSKGTILIDIFEDLTVALVNDVVADVDKYSLSSLQKDIDTLEKIYPLEGVVNLIQMGFSTVGHLGFGTIFALRMVGTAKLLPESLLMFICLRTSWMG